MDLVGREAELAALRADLRDVTSGTGRVVMVSGDPGIGKSTLVDAFRVDALAAGATWLWGAAWEDLGAPAYWPWTQVVRSASRIAAEEVAARTGELGALWPTDSTERVPEQFVLYDAVADLLAALSEQAPVVVVLEDLHAAGVATARLLEFVARFNRHVPVLLIGTYRPAEVAADGELSAIIARLEETGTSLAPAPLPGPEIAAVLEAAGVHPDARLVSNVADRTQGNPLFVTHVARRLAAGATIGDTGLPLGLRSALRRQAERATSTSDVPEALDAASVLGVDLTVEILSTVLGATASQVQPALDAAVAAGLLSAESADLDRYEFTHTVVREALYDGINPSRRAQLHLSTAQALAAAGAGPDRLGHHFASAWPAGGAAEAAELSRLAADRATAAHAHAEAVALYQQALTARGRIPGAEPAARCALLLELTAARFRAGRTAEAHATARLAGDLAASIGDVELISRAALLVASHLPFNAIDHDAISALRNADEQSAGVVSATRVAVLARLAGVTAPLDRAEAAAIAGRAEEVATALSADVAESDRNASLTAALCAQLEVAWGRHDPANARETARRLADAAVGSADEATAAIWDLVFSLELGDTAAAESAVHSIEKLASRERQPQLRHLAISRRAMLTILRGDLRQGLLLAHEAKAVAAGADLPDGDAVLWGQLFAVWTQSGLDDDEAASMERIATDLAASSPFEAAHAAAVVQMLGARGEVAEARALFGRLMTSLDSLERDLLYAWTLSVLSEDAGLLGDTDAAAILYERLLPFADRFVVAAGGVACVGSASHQLGKLAGLLGWTETAREHLAAAVEAHRTAECSALVTASERALAELSPIAAAFSQVGQVITARYGQDAVQLPASLGLRYLSVLAANPGVPMNATRLVAISSDAGATRGVENAVTGQVRPADEVIDKAALASYRARLADIEAEREEAASWNDRGRSARLEEERSFLLDELSRAVGLGGRTRRFADEAERARVNVTRAIRSAIRKIETQAPELGAHLDRCVTTGGQCLYDPGLEPSS